MKKVEKQRKERLSRGNLKKKPHPKFKNNKKG